MTFLKNTLTTLWEGLGLATWLEITTADPPCTYYFGPFLTEAEAKEYQQDFINDLEAEGAQGIELAIKQCRRPEQLTIDRSTQIPETSDFTPLDTAATDPNPAES